MVISTMFPKNPRNIIWMILNNLKGWLIQRKYAKMQKYFRTVNCAELIENSKKRVLEVFHFAAKKVPAYRDFLSKHGINPRKIRTIIDFHDHVPILTKKDLFVDYSLKDWSVNGDYGSPVSFFVSSGFSGTYSYGINDERRYKKSTLHSEFLLNIVFDIFKKKTIVLNCHLGGLRLPVRRLSILEVSAQTKAVLDFLDKLSGDFDQFLVMGEQQFIKDLVEEGIYRGFDWNRQQIYFITGGEFMPESLRSHMASLLKWDFNDPSRGMIYSNFGITEIALSMFNENICTIRIRRAADKDKNLRREIFGREDLNYTPSIMHYFPQNIYVESLLLGGSSQLVVSSLYMNRKMPIIRYSTDDCMRTIGHTTLCNKLIKCGYSNLCPEYHLPVGLIWDNRRNYDKTKR